MMTVDETLAAARGYLASRGLASPREDAEVIVASVTGSSRTYLITHPEHRLSLGETVGVWRWLAKRSQHYPLQYLRGFQEFYGRDFLVSPEVLVPRAETELLVDTCLELLGEKGMSARLLDVGTGSGCIAISLLLELKTLYAVATDISESALNVAGWNARKHSCADRLQLLHGDLAEPVQSAGRNFDLVVSNPPYVAAADRGSVALSVAKFEPPVAVFAGKSGLNVYRRIFAQVSSVLAKGGNLVLELGYDQATAVSEVGRTFGWVQHSLHKDLAGIDRCAVFGR